MSLLSRIKDWLPHDMELPDEEFRDRHKTMTILLVLHLPVLAWFGWSRGAELVPLGAELAPMLVAAGIAVVGAVPRTAKAFAAASGLLYGSLVLLHLSGGAPEAAVHFLMVLAFAFLYREWSLFGWTLLVMAVSYRLLDLASPFFDATGIEVVQPEMALGAVVAAGSLASIGLILAWKSAGEHLSSAVEATELAAEREEAAKRRDAYGKMYVNLARRSQSLVDKQLGVIDKLEQDVEDPDVLADVFELDHLTTRIRRHGESLLVVADVDLPSRAETAVPLSDVVRGAQAEIEQYRRVDAQLDPAIAVNGAVTRDLIHLLAELLDNATTYSPPNTTVKVHARAGDSGSVVVTVEDRGLGLPPDRLAQANNDLQDPRALDENAIRHLGLRVVARLAAKHDITVRLTTTNGGGITAWVEVPATAIATGDVAQLPPARVPAAPTADIDTVVDDLEILFDDDVVAEELGEPTPAAPPAPPAPPTPTAPAAPAPTAELPQRRTPPTPTADPEPSVTEPAPPAAPTPLSAGFSANGTRKRGLRKRRSADREPQSHPTPSAPAAQVDAPEVDQTAPPQRPPLVDAPLPTGPLAMPKPKPAQQSAPAVFGRTPDTAATSAPAPSESTVAGPDGAPALPQRQRGATVADRGAEEAMDLFGGFGDDGERASLGDFQRGQDDARKETR